MDSDPMRKSSGQADPFGFLSGSETGGSEQEKAEKSEERVENYPEETDSETESVVAEETEMSDENEQSSEESETGEDSRDKDKGAGEKKEKTIHDINPFKSLKNLTLYGIANSEKFRSLMGMTMGDGPTDGGYVVERGDFYASLAKEEIERRKEAGEFYPEKDVDIREDFNEKFYVSNGNPVVVYGRYSWDRRDATYEEVMEVRNGHKPDGYEADDTAGKVYLRDEDGKLTQMTVQKAICDALGSEENIDNADKMIDDSYFDNDFKERLKEVVDSARNRVDWKRYQALKAQIQENSDEDEIEKIIDGANISARRKALLKEDIEKRRYEIRKAQIQENPDDAERIIGEAKISEQKKKELEEEVASHRYWACRDQIRENPDDAERIIDGAKINNEIKEQLREYTEKERYEACKAQIQENPDDAERIIDEAKIGDERKRYLIVHKYNELYKNGDDEECERIDKKFGVVDGYFLEALGRVWSNFEFIEGRPHYDHFYKPIPGEVLDKKAGEELEKEKNEFIEIFDTLISSEEKEKIASEMVVGNSGDRWLFCKEFGSSLGASALADVMERIKNGHLYGGCNGHGHWYDGNYSDAVRDIIKRMVDGRIFEIFCTKASEKSVGEFFRSGVFKDIDDEFFVEKGMDWLRNSLTEVLARGARREEDDEWQPHFVFETEEYKKYKDEIGIDFDDPKMFDLCFEGWKNTIEKKNGQFSNAQRWYFENVFSKDFGRFQDYVRTLREVTYADSLGKKGKLTQAIRDLSDNTNYNECQENYIREQEPEKWQIIMKKIGPEAMEELLKQYRDLHKDSIRMFTRRSVYDGHSEERQGVNPKDDRLPQYGFFKAQEIMNLFNYFDMNLDWPGKNTETEEERRNNPHAPHFYTQQFNSDGKDEKREITMNEFLDEPSFYIGFTFEYNGQACAIFDNLGCKKGGGRFVMKDKTGDGEKGLLENFIHSREEVRKRGEITGDAIRLNHMADVDGYQIMEPLRDLNIRTLYWLKYDRKYNGGSDKRRYGTDYPELEDVDNKAGELLENGENGEMFDDMRDDESTMEFADRTARASELVRQQGHDDKERLLNDLFI